MLLTPEEVLKILTKLRNEDPSYLNGEVLGSMTTEPPQYLVNAYEIFMNTNLNDHKLFKNTYTLERESIEWLSKLFYGDGYGFLTYGGTESNITALYILREFTGGDVVIAPTTAHVSIRKACKLLKLKLIEVPVNSNYVPEVNEVCRAIHEYEERIACVVMTAGTTDLGLVEPVDKLVNECRGNYLIHVDAAYGGILAQFIRDVNPSIPIFDFRLDKVYSITVDLHKIVTPIPCSALLTRSKELEELAYFNAPYMPSGFQRTLLGTRCGGIAATAWAAIKVLGSGGFKELALELLGRAKYLSTKLRNLGLDVLVEPKLPLVTFRVPHTDVVLQKLWERRMFVYPTSIPNTLRVVVGLHITHNIIDRFVNSLATILKDLGY